MADPAIENSEDKLLREESSQNMNVKTKSVSILLEEWNLMKETQSQILAVLKAGTLGNAVAQRARGRKRKVDNSSDDRTDTSDGDTQKENRARKSKTGGKELSKCANERKSKGMQWTI